MARPVIEGSGSGEGGGFAAVDDTGEHKVFLEAFVLTGPSFDL